MCIVFNCPIDLQEGACPQFGLFYGLFEQKLEDLQTFINENFKKGFIQPSKSLIEAPILFVREKDDSLYLYVNYCSLNKITTCNCYPLSLIPKLLVHL